ncbi:MAG: choice-of-anchor J domain-containing protein [Rikenellaceae bacterium]
MKKRIKNILISSTLIASAILSLPSCGTECDEYGVPLTYSTHEQYLDVDFDRYEVDNVDLTQLLIPISASSAWSVTSSESWAVPDDIFFMGDTNLVLNVELNRIEERSTTITITMTTAQEVFVESFELVQGVSDAAEISTPTSLSVSDEGGVTTLAVSYNYGLKATVTEGGDWINLEGQSEVVLDADRQEYVLKDGQINLYFDECGADNREAVVVFSSTDDPEVTSTLYITQLAVIDPVIKFVDDFSESNASNSGTEFIPNPDMNWRIQNYNTSVSFKHYYWAGSTTYIYPWTNLLAYSADSSVEAYLILPPFDATRASERTFSFWLGTSAGTYDNSAGTGAKLEVVYSTNFKGDAFAGDGTWSLLQDYTWSGTVTNVLPKTCYELSLEGFAQEENLTIAFRYTGGSPALGYRIDNVRLGVAPHENQDQDDGDQYVN